MGCERRALVGQERHDADRGFLRSDGCPAIRAGAGRRAAAAQGIQRGSLAASRQARRGSITGWRCADGAFLRAADSGAASGVSSMTIDAARHRRHGLNACTWALLLAVSKDLLFESGRMVLQRVAEEN